MSTLSVWEKETFFAPQDIIIIGSGYTGLWSAVKLLEKNPRLKITILERGIIPSGASTRNAGFSCFGSPSELVHDATQMGEDNLWQLVEMRYKGLLEIRKNFSEAAIEYCADGGYECFEPGSTDWALCMDKLAWLNNGLKQISGNSNTYITADAKLKQFKLNGFNHLIENKEEGGLHSGKLLQALLHKVSAAGVQVLTGVHVRSFYTSSSKLVIETDNNILFTAQQLLLCTNAFTRQLVPHADVQPYRGQVFITAPVPQLALKGAFHFQRGFYYFRNLGNRLLIGGARDTAIETENTDDMSITSAIQNHLEQFVDTHILPRNTYSIESRWSGIMGMGSSKMPIIEELEPGIFCCVRMSGMGVALAPVAAAKIAALITGS
ncbi:MAG TPA: FAD-dependent oxidoreductase [Ferruginibacter sp.]|nr:FAD-dependent oxidoreductase [Ferruginibacter sp.]HMP20047.1 FAD-dependent oxidoreductase [Ferruginibacter sp.]